MILSFLGSMRKLCFYFICFLFVCFVFFLLLDQEQTWKRVSKTWGGFPGPGEGWRTVTGARARGRFTSGAHHCKFPKIETGKCLWMFSFSACLKPWAGLPTFRNCLEGETSSAERKNPWVWSRPAYRATDGVQGESPTGVQGVPPCVGKFVFGEVECISSGP